ERAPEHGGEGLRRRAPEQIPDRDGAPAAEQRLPPGGPPILERHGRRHTSIPPRSEAQKPDAQKRNGVARGQIVSSTSGRRSSSRRTPVSTAPEASTATTTPVTTQNHPSVRRLPPSPSTTGLGLSCTRSARVDPGASSTRRCSGSKPSARTSTT